MNNCEMYQELISRLMDGELSRDEYAALDTHMENCAECSAMYAVFASLSDIIGGEDEPLPEDLHENIMAGVRRSAMIKHNRRRLSKPVRNALTAAACAALVLFASRGLAPEKAADTALTKSQTVAMDVQLEEAAVEEEEQPAYEAAAAAESPAAAVTPATVESAPAATPVPSPDIYLESEKTEAKPAENNNRPNTNTVTVTPRPTEIPVDTPVTVNTPRPAASPAQVVTITASPMPPAPVQPADVPAVVAEVAEAKAEPEVSGAPAAMEDAAGESETAAASPAAVSEEEDSDAAYEEPVPAETEEPSLTRKFMSFFGLARPEAVSEPVEEVPAEEESEALPEEAPAESEPAAETPVPAENEEAEPGLIKLESTDKLTELENLLDGKEAQLPEGDGDKEYTFVAAQPEEGLEDYGIKVLIYGESIYYVQTFSEDDFFVGLAPCSVEEFERFMDTLSDSEKGIETSPTPTASAAPELSSLPAEVTETPAVSAQPAQSPAPSETPAEQQ